MAMFQFIDWIIEWFRELEKIEFEWDSGNQSKNLTKHGITCDEAEAVFKNRSDFRILGIQTRPKVNENRFGALGKTDEETKMFVCFTFRKNKIRVIHIRKMNQKEKKDYAKICEK